MQELIEAKFSIGNVIKHKFLNFRGVIFDLDPSFNNTEEWYNAIPKNIRPKKDQPFYHIFAENEEIFYIAYVSEQNLLDDLKGGPPITRILKRYSHTLMENLTFRMELQQNKLQLQNEQFQQRL